MVFEAVKKRISEGAVAMALLAMAGCQSGDGSSALDLNAGNSATPVKESELRAFCPPVELREGTAYFSTYERGGEKDKDQSRLIYQASISDVTRSCTYPEGMLNMNVAVAGRIVPGPKGRVGTITMPIRVVLLQDGQVVYSQLTKYPVAVNDTIGATQFVFNDTGISIPRPTNTRLIVYAGYDEGPGS